MTGLVQQYFDYTDELHELDPLKYAEIKDKMLFGTVYLFTQDRFATYNSSTEQYLGSTTHDKIPSGLLKPGAAYSGLDLALEVQKIKIFFNVSSALLNAAMISANKGGNEDFINTWAAPLDQQSRPSFTQVTAANALSTAD